MSLSFTFCITMSEAGMMKAESEIIPFITVLHMTNANIISTVDFVDEPCPIIPSTMQSRKLSHLYA